MFGLPDCGTKGCPYPGLVRFEFEDDAGPVEVFICPACVPRAPELLKAIAKARQEMRVEQGLLLEHQVPDAPEA